MAEAEWKFAAHGGTESKGFKYSGSDNCGAVAWYGDNSGNKTHEVGTKAANELGIHDMSGNVWEWCADWYGNYSSGAVTDPIGLCSGGFRVDRGGGWDFTARYCHSASRGRRRPGRAWRSGREVAAVECLSVSLAHWRRAGIVAESGRAGPARRPCSGRHDISPPHQ